MNNDDLIIRISFSSHVFSVSPKNGINPDFKDHHNRGRCFCQVRYDVSRSLPDKIRKILESNTFSWSTKDKNNYSNLSVLTDPQFSFTNGTYDVIIYYFYPSSSAHYDVEMNILSCYNTPVNFSNHTRRDKIRSLAKRCFFRKKRVP